MVLGLNVCAVWHCSTYFAISPSLCARASPRAHPPTQHLLSCFPRVISCWLVSRLLPAQLSKCPFLQSHLSSLAISFKPWCPQLCGTTMVFRQRFPQAKEWLLGYTARKYLAHSSAVFQWSSMCNSLGLRGSPASYARVFSLSQNPSVRKQKSISRCSSQLWGSWRETPAQPRAPPASGWKLSWSTCNQNVGWPLRDEAVE